MKAFLTLSIIFLLSTELSGQQWGLGFQSNLGFPVGKLKEGSPGIVIPEFSTVGYYEFWNLPINLGLSIGYGIYGTELEKRRDLYAGFNDQLRLRRNNNSLTIMALFRYLPEVSWKLKPFVELQGGTNYLYTRYKISESRFEEPIEEGRDHADWIGALRFGGGFKIPFKNPEFGFFEFKVIYQETKPVEYLRRGDVEFVPDRDGGQFNFQVRKSNFNFIQPGIGFVLYFHEEF
ncbi:hypothetical protein [Indibacter alkaliphilus]|nr:hypothetical protein [Indibacter alkaliphilus]